MSDAIEELSRLLKESGATICFCTLCNHDQEYGHCYSCKCGNHMSGPDIISDLDIKLKATVDHLKELMKRLAESVNQAVADERERCAKIVEKYGGGSRVAEEIAKEIRYDP